MSMLYVMWAAAVLVGQLLALQEGSAVGWMTKESSINSNFLSLNFNKTKYLHFRTKKQPSNRYKDWL
jgi:hypothetical protein